ncbi:MAG: rhomboid family intramembrane serine protease [Myxococcales bacterium]|nr:rhomboid family intramembrane serine protease [Myxococcales bacterium]
MIPVGGSVRSVRPPVVTVLLIAACVIVFLGELRLPERALAAAIEQYGVIPARQLWALERDAGQLELWLTPLVTSLFLHGGWSHLLGNMLYLWVFGDGVENRLGHARFLLFFLLCGAAAAQAQVLMAPGSVTPMIGASGAIAGVLGSYLALYPWASITMVLPIFFIPYFFDVPALLFVGIWFLHQLLAGAAWTLSTAAAEAGGVAWWAHVGGFLTGVLLLPLFLDRRHHGHEPRHYRGPYRYTLRH